MMIFEIDNLLFVYRQQINRIFKMIRDDFTPLTFYDEFIDSHYFS